MRTATRKGCTSLAMRIEPLPKPSLTTACFAAPLITPIVAIPVAALLPGMYSSAFDILIALPFVIVASLIYGYAGMIVVCLPLMLLLKYFNKLSALTLCASTTIVGSAIWMTMFVVGSTPESASAHVRVLLVGAVCSFAVSAFFCILGEIPWRRWYVR